MRYRFLRSYVLMSLKMKNPCEMCLLRTPSICQNIHEISIILKCEINDATSGTNSGVQRAHCTFYLPIIWIAKRNSCTPNSTRTHFISDRLVRYRCKQRGNELANRSWNIWIFFYISIDFIRIYIKWDIPKGIHGISGKWKYISIDIAVRSSSLSKI